MAKTLPKCDPNGLPPEKNGTKASAHYHLTVKAGGTSTIRLRLNKWIRHRAGYEREFLAAPEVSTLIDLASSYQNIQKMQTLPFDKSSIVVLAVSFAVPMLSVILAEVPLATVVKDLLQALK